MQKIKQLILMIILILLCTSCADVRYEMEINKDGSANFSYILEANKEDFEAYQNKYEAIIENAKVTLEQSGFSVNEYNDEEKIKFEAKTYINDIKKIDEYAILLEPIADDIPMIIHTKNLFFERYEINGKIDLTSYSETKNDLERDKVIADNLPIKFNLKLPTDAKESNANEANGKELIWNLKYNQENIISAKYEIINYVYVVILCIILFAVVQFVTVIIVRKIIKIRSENTEKM